MKTKLSSLLPALVLALLATLNSQLSTCLAQGTAFTYQGRLNFNASPAAGNFDFRFRIASDGNGNNFVGSAVITNGVPVTNGLFLTTLDFGAGIFTGGNLWLQIEVKTNGAAGYALLNPLQPLTPTPYAMFANTASNVSGTVSASQISGGALLNSVLPTSPSFSGTVSANQISGNGANVTNVNAVLLNGKSAANFWQTGGNAGTSPTNGNFLGTTDNQPLELRINNQRALRLEPTAYGFGTGFVNVIGGSPGNYMPPGTVGCVIAGGGGINAFSQPASNTVSGFTSFLGGGLNNSMLNANSCVLGGGQRNSILDNSGACFLGAGQNNLISSNVTGAFIGAGYQNFIQTNANGAFIGGGNLNQIGPSAYGAVVPGGFLNSALGAYSFAAGQQAQALHQGSFVWADSQNTTFASTANDQFCIRAQGGVQLDNSTSLNFGSAARQMLNLFTSGSANYGIGVQASTLYFRTGGDLPGNGFAWYRGGTNNLNQNNSGGGATLMTLNNTGLVISGGITSSMWKATTVINTNGALSKTNTFTTGGGTLMISASGSGYSVAGNVSIGMDIKLDGATIDNCQIYANPSGTHLAFVPKTFVQTGVAAGSHTLILSARAGTTTDNSDNFCVTVQELPF